MQVQAIMPPLTNVRTTGLVGACLGTATGSVPLRLPRLKGLGHETGGALNQRAENGALDPWSLDLRLGCPTYLPQIAPKPFKTRVLWPLDWKSGRTKNADSTTTDPMPQSRPSE